MNRRDFLKAGLAVIAAAALPEIAADAARDVPVVIGVDPALPGSDHTVVFGKYDNIVFYDEHSAIPEKIWEAFNPRHEYGNSLPLTYRPTTHLFNQLVELLYRDMVKHIPPGFRNRVEVLVRPARHDGIAWIYRPPKPWEAVI